MDAIAEDEDDEEESGGLALLYITPWGSQLFF